MDSQKNMVLEVDTHKHTLKPQRKGKAKQTDNIQIPAKQKHKTQNTKKHTKSKPNILQTQIAGGGARAKVDEARREPGKQG